MLASAWCSVFVVMYVAVYRATAQSPYMRGFWEGRFLDPRAADFPLRLRLFGIAAFSAPTLTGQLPVPASVLALAWAGGVWTLWRRRPFAAVVTAAPLVLAAVACAVGLYVVMDRLFLFVAPLTVMAYASLLA